MISGERHILFMSRLYETNIFGFGSFADRQVRDRCLSSEVGALSLTYQPPDFVIKALQHTNVDCSWDQGEKERDSKLSNMSKWRELQESDFQQYIASENDSDEESDRYQSCIYEF